MKLEELEIYKLAMEFAEKIWSIAIKWDYFNKKTVGEQLVRVADSIAANISEGYGRFHYKERLLQKSLFVIPEVFIGNPATVGYPTWCPIFFKIKNFWIPAFAGMTTIAILSILLQEAQENKQFCYYARGSTSEAKTWLTKSYKRGLIGKNDFQFLQNDMETIALKLNNYINSIGKRK